MQRAVDAAIKNSLLSFFRVLGQDSRSLPPTITQRELVGVYRRLLAHQELAKALDKEIYRDTDGLASRERGRHQSTRCPLAIVGHLLGFEDRVMAAGDHSNKRNIRVDCLVPSALTVASPKSYLLGSCACSDSHYPLTPGKSEAPSVGKQMVLLKPTLSWKRGVKCPSG